MDTCVSAKLWNLLWVKLIKLTWWSGSFVSSVTLLLIFLLLILLFLHLVLLLSSLLVLVFRHVFFTSSLLCITLIVCCSLAWSCKSAFHSFFPDLILILVHVLISLHVLVLLPILVLLVKLSVLEVFVLSVTHILVKVLFVLW
jgi:hypothetical protein